MTADLWQPLDAALSRWRAAGRTPAFWLRDDDAVAPTPALQRLLDLAHAHAVPLALAVIPVGATQALADLLRADRATTVLVHGWSHRNHAPAGEKKCELGLHRPQEAVLGELQASLRRIDALFSDQALPVLVPPWNRIDAGLVGHLAPLGYRAMSVFGPSRHGGFPMLNTTVDIMDWRGSRGCRPVADIVTEIVQQLDAGLAEAQTRPIGLLTHHLVHDEAAWRFLGDLFAVTRRAGLDWKAVGPLLEEVVAPTA